MNCILFLLHSIPTSLASIRLEGGGGRLWRSLNSLLRVTLLLNIIPLFQV